MKIYICTSGTDIESTHNAVISPVDDYNKKCGYGLKGMDIPEDKLLELIFKLADNNQSEDEN